MTIEDIENLAYKNKEKVSGVELMQTLYRYYSDKNEDKFLHWSDMTRKYGWLAAKNEPVKQHESIKMVFDAHCERARAGRVEDFMIGIEFWKRKNKKFYEPRQSTLKPLVDDLQDLFDGKIIGLSISMPPRTGKSELGKRFTAFCMGMNSDESILFASHTNPMVRKFYNEIIQLMESPEYSWKDIFPSVNICDRSAEDSYIDVGEKNTYKSFYARSIDSNMSGVLEASFLLYCDDLIRSSEEARNPDRVKTAVVKYIEDIRQRRVSENVRELHIGTRWAMNDIIGVLEEEHKNNPLWRFRRVAALNEIGESNFSYMRKEHFAEQKRMMFISDGNDISFNMIFQQEPADREGIMFPYGALKKYDELPQGLPDRVIMSVDVAWGGNDYFSAPIGLQYGKDVYICDVIHCNRENATKDKTYKRVVEAVKNYKINAVHIEANNGGDEYADKIRELLRAENIRCAVTDARVPTNRSKNDRIISATPEILCTDEQGYKLLFKKQQDGEYGVFMRHITSYNSNPKYAGKQTDDAPDALASLVTNLLVYKDISTKITTYNRAALGF